jgi:hypothetical protein
MPNRYDLAASHPAHKRAIFTAASQIIVHLAEKAGVQKKLDREAREALTLISPFGFGAPAATIYSLVEARIPGKAFGGSLACELFWILPAVGILELPTKQSFSRNALMLGVHLIWGLIVGAHSLKLYWPRKGAPSAGRAR